ncbi:hypothetical protein MMC12_006228 [Toensbergia leucococca]|nr:hypothetical protein [Toensbergia leucococca]
MSQDADVERDAPLLTSAKTSAREPPPRLIKFRNLTGIHTPDSLVVTNPPRPARNLGIYARIVSEETKASYQYHFMATIIEVSFLSQIVVAATLTALSAASVSHIVIAILGSVNTVIAGLQTYLKGQGLPNRIRQYQFGLRKLREHIENREREFSDEECKLDVDTVIADVSAMYAAVRQTAEDNTPDTYLPMGGAAKKLLGDKAVGGSGKQDLGPGDGISKDGAQATDEVDGSEAPKVGDASGTAGNDMADEETRREDLLKSGDAAASKDKPDTAHDTEETPLLRGRS